VGGAINQLAIDDQTLCATEALGSRFAVVSRSYERCLPCCNLPVWPAWTSVLAVSSFCRPATQFAVGQGGRARVGIHVQGGMMALSNKYNGHREQHGYRENTDIR
jgi:hypothetical protein